MDRKIQEIANQLSNVIIYDGVSPADAKILSEILEGMKDDRNEWAEAEEVIHDTTMRDDFNHAEDMANAVILGTMKKFATTN